MWKSLQYAKRQKAIKIILWLRYCQFISRNMLSAFFRPIFCILVFALSIFFFIDRPTGQPHKMQKWNEQKADTTFYELLRGPHATWWRDCVCVCATKAQRQKAIWPIISKICSQTVKSRVTLLNNVQSAVCVHCSHHSFQKYHLE